MADDRFINSSTIDQRGHRRFYEDLNETEKAMLSGKGGTTKLRDESTKGRATTFINDGPTPMLRNKSHPSKSHLEGPALVTAAPKIYRASKSPHTSPPTTATVDQDEAPISARSSREPPHAVQIVLSKDDHTFDLDDLALESILMRDDVKDRFVVIVSVAGGFRKGKSFMLDFFLRYLKNIGSTQWLGKEDEPLEGFSWRGGAERDTTGILIWSEPFLIDTPSGDKVAVILMDTQGAFDSESTVRDCATVFALSTMISSVQIFNLLHNIQEDDLQHLQLFTEYGKLALADSGATPFQKLQFLVRDWSFPYEAPFGTRGGEQLLNKRLKISEKQHPELQSLRKHIRSCFSSISCFLMPHPGLRVATSPDFDGKLSEIEVEFKKHLELFVPELLAPENLVIKEIAGQKIRAKELLQYFKAYIEMYKGNELPEPKSMLLATAEANNLAAIVMAKETYQHLMETVCGGTTPYMSTAHLESEHLRNKEKAIHQFNSKRKMGGEEFIESYREKLEKDLEDMLVNFRSMNESKNVFKAARTPAVYFALAVGFYIASGIFGLLGLYALANSANFIMGIALLTLIIWAYIRYSGEFREIGTQLDDLASFLWENFMKPLYQNFLEQQMRNAAIHYTETAASAALGSTNTTSSSTQVNGKLKH